MILSKTEKSPQSYARTGGVLYLIMIILGIIVELFIKGKIIVSDDAAATAANLKSMESLWRMGIVFELLMAVIAIWLSLILYYLTKFVSKNLALLALFFGLVATTVGAVNSLELLKVLFPLSGADYLQVFTPEQLNAFANIAIKSHDMGFGVSLLLFAPFFFVTGYLIIKSGYIPKTLGILYLIPGLSYLTSSLALILAPAFADKYYFVMASPTIIGELSLCLWLMVKGVNMEKWNEKTMAK